MRRNLKFTNCLSAHACIIEWLHGMKNGHGVYQHASGSIYDGEWENDEKNGTGFYSYINGDSYIGGFKDNLIHGEGVYNYNTGAVYAGSWVSNNKTGYGTHTYPNGDVYVGNWVDNNKCGYGEYTYTSGASYKGAWKDDDKSGQGVYEYPNGDTYDGDFVKGSMHGHGLYMYSNGAFYEGEWFDNKKEGFGKYVYGNGEEYVGHWVANVKEGNGRYVYADGEIKDGVWKNDMFAGPPMESFVATSFATASSHTSSGQQTRESGQNFNFGTSVARRVKLKAKRRQQVSDSISTSSWKVLPLPPPQRSSATHIQPTFPSSLPPNLTLLKSKIGSDENCSGAIIEAAEAVAAPAPRNLQKSSPKAPAAEMSPPNKEHMKTIVVANAPTSDVADVDVLQTRTPTASDNSNDANLCVICMDAVRDGAIVHADGVHACCCLECAHILKMAGKGCPVCQGPIDIVLKLFSA